MNFRYKYQKIFSLLNLLFYSGILFYGSFHYHTIKYSEEVKIAVENQLTGIQNNHSGTFCLIFHFASNQNFSSTDSDYKLILPEINHLSPSNVNLQNISKTSFLLHRGPPLS